MPQPGVYLALEYRSGQAGAESFAVDNAHTGQAGFDGMLDETLEFHARIGVRNAVQVYFGLDAEIAAGEFAHCLATNARAAKAQAVTAAGFKVIEVGLEAFL